MVRGMADRDADKSRHVLAHLPRIHRSVIAGDDAAVFELFDPLDHRGRREPDLFAKLDQRNSAVLLQNRDDLQIDRIGLEGLA